MVKTRYPITDASTSADCGDCVVKCPHDSTAKAPSSVVKTPEACVDNCPCCGSRCPVGGTTLGCDEAGWIMAKGELTEEESCCSGGCGGNTKKKIIVEYLYLDLETCDRCIGTDKVLDEVMMTLTPALELAGFEVEYNKVAMKTAEIAEQYKFLSSPTIRVNGQDICQSTAENSCGCCSDLSGTDVSCRVFEYNGETYEVPPKEMLAEVILQAVFGHVKADCSCGEYELPENLKEFFGGKKSKSNCSRGGNCC